MQYHYQVLESVLKNIAKDGSIENIFDEIARLTSDERHHLSYLMAAMEDASHQVARDLGEYV